MAGSLQLTHLHLHHLHARPWKCNMGPSFGFCWKLLSLRKAWKSSQSLAEDLSLANLLQDREKGVDAPNHALCEAHGLPAPGIDGIAQSPQPWVLGSALAAWELKHQAVSLGNWMSCGRAAAYAGRTYDILRHPTTSYDSCNRSLLTTVTSWSRSRFGGNGSRLSSMESKHRRSHQWSWRKGWKKNHYETKHRDLDGHDTVVYCRTLSPWKRRTLCRHKTHNALLCAGIGWPCFKFSQKKWHRISIRHCSREWRTTL